MKVADRILELLYDRGEKFFNLDELAAAAGTTPRGRDSAIDMLRQRGHELESLPGAGVRLRRPVAFDAHLVERDLGTKRVGRHVICFDEVGSTNDVAADSARQKGSDGLVVLAQSQRKGRGRQGRRWISPPGSGILMSVLLTGGGRNAGGRETCEQVANSHECLTIAAGLAVAEGVEQASGLSCELKWPNDVQVAGRKLAGVLVEVHTSPAACVVIGIGINVNAAPPSSDVDRPAACIADCLGHEADRLEIVQAVLRRLDERIEKLDDVDELRLAWLDRCDMLNHRVTVACAGRQYVGRVLDISPLEGLTLQCDGGQQVHLRAANSSIVAKR